MIEKISIRFADHVITPNIAFRELFIKRGCDPKKIDVVMNTPMEKIFLDRKQEVSNIISRKNGEFVVMYHGTITLRNGCIDIIDAINRIKSYIPNIKFHIFGNGDAVDLVKDKINELGLSKIIIYYGLVKNEVISDAIREIDIGIIPNQMNPFTNHNFPVRIFEYLALKKPVIVPETKGIKDYFDQDSIIYFDPGNISDLADKILNCYRHPEKLQQKVERGIKIYQQFTWSKQRITLENIAATLIMN